LIFLLFDISVIHRGEMEVQNLLDSVLEERLCSILDKCGVEINGNNDYDIWVLDNNFYRKVLFSGTLGLGEAYMAGLWECERIDKFVSLVLSADIDKEIRINPSAFILSIMPWFLNLQSVKRAFNIGKAHYDFSNEFFSQMLDKRMIYSCGFWHGAENLDEAQENKLDLICRKIYLEPGMKILDIGCGWGGFAKFAAEKYGANVVGITVSKEQAEFAKINCHGLPVEIRLQDYRSLDYEKFDRIVSIGMFEHVGPRNYQAYMKAVHSCLTDNGLFLLHTIGGNKSVFSVDPWINKYIFPGGVLPSIKQIGESIEKFFVMEDWHNFGTDYDKTLMEWYENFEKTWSDIRNQYDEKFYRMWKYYLLVCAGAFRARNIQLWQIILSKKIFGEYKSIHY